MALSKLQIVPEKEGEYLQFDESGVIDALFNPTLLSFDRSVGWKSAGAAQRDVPELEFTSAEPRTLTLELIFDTYDTPTAKKGDVRKKYADKMLHLTTVEKHGDKHRPPVCRLRWGAAGRFFQGVVEKLEQKFTMFVEDGTPVRAMVTCTFKEWRTNEEDAIIQHRESSDVAKLWVVKRGDSLSSIAGQEYMDPAMWRPIAVKNHIDNPLMLTPGQVLVIPQLSPHDVSRRRRSYP
jgi:nucleoid-associated protein YgaU